ncbi:peptidylprolyl isomerase [Aurantibacter aestuarii]|uniref:peptidylprolyl isomerase n=1 Tax=Aurantibacter aestuarii TaxID=1266046 RepID=A0A2T1N530_9FLAO|nr:peptidylprolyl isomerase [Aurantibacter aestuarii]PSG86382.1 peptidylprolyl isomerase [Aurantibacter aestuarii]
MKKNSLKHFFKLLMLTILAGLTNASCQGKYPKLEDGMYAEIVTNKGTMVAELHFEQTPTTVANFVSLAEGTNTKVDTAYTNKKFYNGTTFHRVMDKFMIQGGDPTGTGAGSPGYRFGDEFVDSLKHDKPGILSMANSGPKTNGSQFFITEVPTPHLNNKHTVFGELVVGLDVQDSISNVKVGAGSKPIDSVVIKEVNIIRKGKAAKKFDAPKVFENHFIQLEEEKKALQALLEKAKTEFIQKNNAANGEVKKLESGLVMIFTKKGEGVKPTPQDQVLIDYAGYLEDGTLFDTSMAEVAKNNGKYDEVRDQKGMYVPFPMIYNQSARLVPGFREAMLNMNVGDEARIFIPSFLAYGERGAGGGLIPPNANLIFDLKIVDTVKK